MFNKSILILEDEVTLRTSLSIDFQELGFKVFEAENIYSITEEEFNFALIDLRVGQDSGLDAIRYIISKNKNCKIVMYTGFGSIASAVSAVKLGAIQYLTKPVDLKSILKAFELDSVGNISEHVKKYKRFTLSQNEHEYINLVLKENGGNISKTARDLGIHRQSLQRKLKKNP